jgi:L-ascorbate metabolism protein UlaG (beta-lactamase superfamily)
MRANPNLRLVIPEANRDFVADRLACDPGWPVGVNDGESVQIDAFRIHAVPAAHEELAPQYLGFVVSFGPWTVYHSGDTLLYDGMIETLQPFEVDVALLPINGKVGNMNAREAAWLGRQIGASLVIPMHYGMFTFNTAPPEEFDYAAELERQPYRILECGERWDSSTIRPRKESRE